MSRLDAIDKSLAAIWTISLVLACISENWMAAIACAGCVHLVIAREPR